MSLQVWLPLNGDLHNQGLSNFNIVTNNVTFVNTGKIGQCASFNGSNSYIYINNINLGNNWSYGCWINTPVSDSRGWEIVIILNNTGSDADSQLAFWVHQKENRFETLANTQYNSTISYAAYYGTWHHFFATFNGNVLTTYMDGIIVNTKTITAAQYTGTNLTIGARCTGANGSSFGNYFQGQLNDIRLYDHCLSEKEVKEISQGLILHYELNNNGLSGTNLALHTQLLTPAAAKTNLNMSVRGAATRQLRSDGFYESKCTAAWQGLSFWENQLNLTVGTKITYSFYIYGNGSSRAFSFYPMMYNSAGTRDTTTGMPISIDGGSFTTVNAKAFSATTATVPEFHYVTFEWNQAVANIISNGGSVELSIQVHGTWNTGDWTCIFAPKVEIGTAPTKWSPAPLDLEIPNIIYDSSGYNNNANIIGPVTFEQNSPKYNIALNMNNTSTSNHIECLNEIILPTDGITATIWVKCNKSTSQVIFAHPQIEFGILSNLGYCHPNSNQAGWTLNNFVTNAWNFIAIVKQNTTYQLYVNGILETQNGAQNNYNHNKNTLWLLNRGNNNTYAANASICDFCMYATALSANDVLELYKTSKIVNGTTVTARNLE